MGFIFSINGIYHMIKNYYQIYRLNKFKKNLLKENNELKNKINLSSSKEFIEYSARIRLGLKKPDEIEYRFEPPQDE